MRTEWVKKQKELLNIEKDEEIAQLSDKITSLKANECQNLGLSILSIEIESSRVSMFGRICLSLQRCDKKPLPKSQIKVGDELTLYCPKLKHTTNENSSSIFGLCSKISNNIIEIVCSDDIDEENFIPPLRLDLRASEATHNKMVHALTDLECDSENPLTNLLFSPAGLEQSNWIREICSVEELKEISLINKNLNDSQEEAVRCALSASHISLIHGPPGTGKTSTVVELILQAVALNQKVLVCAPSNVAVDNVLERLVNSIAHPKGSKSIKDIIPKFLRIGHPARVKPEILQFCLDALILTNDGTEIVKDVRKEIDTLRRTMSKPSRGNYGLRREQRGEMKILRRELRTREQVVVKSIIENRNVVLSTCVGAATKLLKDVKFDLVVIDESAQALEASCWIPILKGSKVVLAGDHKQLAPTIKSKMAEKQGLAVTLFERIIQNNLFDKCVRLLNMQYRMNSLISDWASECSYGGNLISDKSVANHVLNDLNPTNEDLLECPVVLVLDTAGSDYAEESCNEGSHRNFREAVSFFFILH
jgi:superfamily I DNA and/or RNA helicase